MLQRISVPKCSESSSPRKTPLLGLTENEGNKIFLNVKYLNDIRWVRQNTTLYYNVMCHRTDNMFRPFTIRPSSGLTSRAKEEIVKL